MMRIAALCLLLVALIVQPAKAQWRQVCDGKKCYWVYDHPPAAVPSPAPKLEPIPQIPQGVPVSKPGVGDAVGEMPTGVDSSKGIGNAPSVTVGGDAQSTPQNAVHSLTLPEDRGKPHVVIVGDDAFRKEAKAKLAKLEGIEQFHVNDYPPGSWHVGGVNLDRQGVTFLAPPGKDGKAPALHFQADLEGLDKPMAEIAGALRNRDPKFDPQKVPDLRHGLLTAAFWAVVIGILWVVLKPLMVFALCVFVIVLLWRNRGAH